MERMLEEAARTAEAKDSQTENAGGFGSLIQTRSKFGNCDLLDLTPQDVFCILSVG